LAQAVLARAGITANTHTNLFVDSEWLAESIDQGVSV